VSRLHLALFQILTVDWTESQRNTLVTVAQQPLDLEHSHADHALLYGASYGKSLLCGPSAPVRGEVHPAVIAAPEFYGLRPPVTCRDHTPCQHETISSLATFS